MKLDRQYGATLIEVMTAVAIFGFASVPILNTVKNGISLYKRNHCAMYALSLASNEAEVVQSEPVDKLVTKSFLVRDGGTRFIVDRKVSASVFRKGRKETTICVRIDTDTADLIKVHLLR